MGKWEQDYEDYWVVILDDDTTAGCDSSDDAGRLISAHNADCAAHEARIAELTAELTAEVAENVRLRTREVGDEMANVLQELTEANNRIAALEAAYKQQYEAMDVLVQDMKSMDAELARATSALERAGFQDHGAEHWKPPIGWGDTGTLTQRLLDTQDELARVKAESLRVVPVGEPCRLGSLRYEQVMYKGRVYEHIQDLDYWTQITGDDPLCLGDLDTIVQPVRLERWEAES